MAGRCVEKLPHDKCGSSDALQVFEENGEHTGFCFSCNTYIPNPYKDGAVAPKIGTRLSKSKEEIAAEMEEIAALSSLDLEHRKLDRETLEHFGVKVALSEEDGKTPTIAYYPHTRNGVVVGYQCKLIDPKKFWWLGDPNDVDLFGWEQAVSSPSKTLFITEGADDALALYQVLKARNKPEYAHFVPAVVSITHGSTGARRDIARQLDAIKAKWEKVVLCFDMDDPGKAAVQSVLQILPDAKAAQLPSKDANQCLLDGRANALASAVLYEAKVPKNTRIISASSLYDIAKEPAKWGLAWPWPKLTDYTRGIRFGETIYIGAGVKMGKGEIRNTIIADLITTHGLKCFVASLEEHNKGTVQRVLGKVAGRIFHDPKIEFDYDAYDKAAELVGDNLKMLDIYQRCEWEHLANDIRVAAKVDGCKAVFIDPITRVVGGNDAGVQNTMLEDIAQELSIMAKDLDIVVFIFCHLKAPVAGPSHEAGGEVVSAQFAGSRAMMRSCNLMLGLWGNKHPDRPEDLRNIRELIILEDREFGASGKVPLFWDKDTGLFTQVQES